MAGRVCGHGGAREAVGSESAGPELSVAFHPTAADQRSATLVVHQNLPAPDTGTTAALAGTGRPAADADTCQDGYVWREAIASDHVCVLPQTRAQARQDNDQAGSRRDPAGGGIRPGHLPERLRLARRHPRRPRLRDTRHPRPDRSRQRRSRQPPSELNIE
jgi:hypothetical protein